MLRNIPNKYSRDKLVERLSQNYRGTLDFLYMPIDFGNQNNVGYAFINFKDSVSCARFVSEFDGVDTKTCLPGFNSTKVCNVTPARVQGLEMSIAHIRNSSIMEQLTDHPNWQPLLFDSEGNPTPFPVVGSRRSRLSKVELEPADPIRQQIEYYFSAENLCHDVFLRSKMDENGWVPLRLIAEFPKVKKLLTDESSGTEEIAPLISDSTSVELDGHGSCVRSRDPSLRSTWAQLPSVAVTKTAMADPEAASS